jgi:hypothetical protein
MVDILVRVLGERWVPGITYLEGKWWSDVEKRFRKPKLEALKTNTAPGPDLCQKSRLKFHFFFF